MIEELKAAVGSNEKIFYEGKPNKKCYILKYAIPLLPAALLWAYIGLSIIAMILNSSEDVTSKIFFIIFMLVFMLPVWFYIGYIFIILKSHKNTNYIITDRAIYVSGGAYEREIETKPLTEISYIKLHRGIFAQIFNVGDIVLSTNSQSHIIINSISNYIGVFNMIKKLETDMYTDARYPNAKRPSDNPGYKTEYKGL